MSKGPIVGTGAYVTVVLLLAVAVWWLIAPAEGHDPPVDEVLPGAEGQQERVEAWDGVGFSITRDQTTEDRQTDSNVQDGEPEEGIADVLLVWLRRLSAVTTLLSLLGWLVGLAFRKEGKRT